MKLACRIRMQSQFALASVPSSTTVLGPNLATCDLLKRTTPRTGSRLPLLQRISSRTWSVALLYLLLDVVAWMVIYGGFGWIRQAVFSTTPFQFIFVNLIELAVVVQALYIIGAYDRNTDQRSLPYTAEHILALAAATAFSALLVYSAATFDQTMKPSRGALLLKFLTFLPISLLYRRSIQSHLAATFANEMFLVIGSGEAAARFYESYRNSPNCQQIHFVDVGNGRAGLPIAGAGSPIIEGDLAEKLENLSRSYSGIILAEEPKSLSTELLERLVRAQFQQVRVYTLESFYETHWRYVPLDVIDLVWPLQGGFQLARIGPYHYLKRLFDLIMATTALVVCAPLLAFVALLIWLESGGSIIFRQQRIAREGGTFTIFKFRTMADRGDAREDIYTRQNDPRVTSVGHWLRLLRLDELPQLVNVIKGDMSLIGPRAEWVKCAQRYEKAIPFYHFRHLVKPGITGWAQVNYRYGESDEDTIEKLKYDLYYIRHYSLKLDAMIVLKTIHVMLFGKGR